MLIRLSPDRLTLWLYSCDTIEDCHCTVQDAKGAFYLTEAILRRAGGSPGWRGICGGKNICIYRLTGLYISIHACICIETWKNVYIYIDMDTHLAKWRNCKYKWKIFDMLYCSRKVYRKLNILIRCWRTVYTVEVLEWTYFTYLFTHVDERVGYKQHWICFLQTCH